MKLGCEISKAEDRSVVYYVQAQTESLLQCFQHT